MKKATSSLAHVYKAALQGLEEEKDRLESEIRQVRALYARHSGGGPGRPPATEATAAASSKPRKARNLSSAARARIAAAQKKRWAEFRKTPKES